MGDHSGFLERAKEAGKAALSMRSPLVINHYDCDGITSGSITSAALAQAGIPHRVNTVRKVDDALIDSLSNEKEIIFTDLGGGTKRVNELVGDVVILDHHQTTEVDKLQLNPHLFGYDGGTEISAAGVAYFAFRVEIELAIVGAIGDMQYPLASLNREILQEGVAAGKAKSEIGLRMYGRQSRPLPQLLAYSDDPYLPGLGGHEERCAQFIENTGIAKNPDGKWPTYAQLDEDGKRKLVGALAVHLAEGAQARVRGAGAVDEKPDLIVGETYVLPKYENAPELYDAGEFSTMLNACGRHEMAPLGMDICLGREGALEKGRELLLQHRRALREGIEYAYRHTRDFGPFLFLDGRGVIEDGIIGVVAGMLYPGGRAKPILALSIDASGKIKASGRGTKKLLENGLNLGLAMRESCAKLGGAGGGHKIAAGATIPPEKLDEFLHDFADVVRAQVSGRP